MRLDGVLDRQLVQPELACDRRELLLARFVEAQPCDRVAGLAGGVQFGEVVRLRRPVSVPVDGAIDDHACNLLACPVGSGSAH
jgi:hypothetical protein